MARAILKFENRESPIGEGPTSFGRTAENDFSFPDNPNISRRHAEIAVRDGRFVVCDLGSSNGTTVNGQPIAGETPLGDGDFITLGNSVIVEFLLEEAPAAATETPAGAGADVAANAAVPAEAPRSKFPLMLGAAGAACGLAVVFAAAAGYVLIADRTASGCAATARIVSPGHGEVIKQETEIQVEVRNEACVGTVHVLLDGEEIASLSQAPYATPLDPKNFPERADGQLYDLTVVIEDTEGNRLPPSREVALQFETRAAEKPKTPGGGPTPSVTPPPIVEGKQPSLIEVQKMTAGVVGKFTGGSFRYNLANPDFLTEVRRRSAEYAAAEGYFERAAPFRETINQAFVREKGLDPSLPYLLAMSRSRFTPAKQGANEGLWQMPAAFANDNAYTVVCPTPDLSDATQECAARAAALYLDDLVVKSFDGDIVYAVAAFGKTTQEALDWKRGLPADRTDFWKTIGEPAQREAVARFFAAAIVAENPRRFGLQKDAPISELYPPIAR